MITSRDESMIKYFEDYKYAIISNLEKMFFKNAQYSYNICRRRLAELQKQGYLKVFRDIATNKNVYIYKDDKIKPPSLHRMILLDLYAELIYLGCEIETFEIEKSWMDGKIRSDAFIIFIFGGRRYHFFIEVQLASHNHGLEKYDSLYEDGEVQKYLNKTHFPRVLLITDREFKDINLKYTKVVRLNTKLDAFATILI